MKPLGLLVRKLRRCSFGLNQLFTLLGLLGAAGLTACASAKVSPRTLDLSHRTGGYSYRQAVADLGRPDVAYQNHRGKTAEWLLIKPLPPSFDLAYECHYTGPEPGAYGGLLRLKFDENDRLKTWNRLEYGLEALPFAPRPGSASAPAIP